jgi:hypothetical protein
MRRTLVLFSVIAGVIAGAAPASAQWDLAIEAPPELASLARRLHGVDEQVMSDALVRGGLALPGRVRVTLVPESSSLAHGTPRWVVGLAAGTESIVIFPARVASYPYDSLESVLRHEVVHLALNARAAGRPLPRWFHEGVAVSIESGWGVTDRVRLVIAGLSGPPLVDLTRLFESDAQPDTAQAYLLAAALVDDLRHRHGAALPGRVAAAVAAGVPFTRAFEQETGTSPDAAAAQAWRSYRQWTSWTPLATSGSAVWGLILALAFAAFFTRLWKRARRRREWNEEDDAETVEPDREQNPP